MHVAKVDAKFDPTIYIAIGAANFGGNGWKLVGLA